MKVRLKKQGSVGVTALVEKKLPNGVKETVLNQTTVKRLPASDDNFASHSPRVGAEVGLKLVSNFNSCSVTAWVELPVPGFTKELVLKTHERAFQIAEDKVLERMESIKPVLAKL